MHFQRLNSPPTVRLDHTANCLGHRGCTAQTAKFSGRSTPVPAILIHRRRKISPQVPKHSYHYVTFVSSLIPPSTSDSSIYQPLHLSTAHPFVSNVKSCSVHRDHLHLLFSSSVWQTWLSSSFPANVLSSFKCAAKLIAAHTASTPLT
jgi:hypothetical protein